MVPFCRCSPLPTDEFLKKVQKNATLSPLVGIESTALYLHSIISNEMPKNLSITKHIISLKINENAHVFFTKQNIYKNKTINYFYRYSEVRKAFASAVGRKHSFGAGDSEEFHHIRSSLLEMKNDIDKHNTAMSQLVDDQNKKQLHLEALYGHVDQLENIKADRQQINREIEVKADRKELEKKVSQDKFHNSLSCLDQSVQDLVEKLVGHVSRFLIDLLLRVSLYCVVLCFVQHAIMLFAFHTGLHF